MDFGTIISRAFRVTWQYRVLWILGFLAALGAGGAGIGQSPQMTMRLGDRDIAPWIQDLTANPNTILAGAAAFVCLVFLISIVLLVIGIIARGGLIAGVQQIETEGNTTFGRAWSIGAARFWHLLGLNILLWLPFIILIILAVIAFGGTIFAAITAASRSRNDGGVALASIIGGSVVVLCCAICILVLYSLLAQAMQTFGERSI